MAVQGSRKRWIKGALLVIGVADCAGIYLAQKRLSTPVPDAVRYDRTAFMVPESSNRFRTDPVQFAEAMPPVASLAAAEPVALTAPELAVGPSAGDIVPVAAPASGESSIPDAARNTARSPAGRMAAALAKPVLTLGRPAPEKPTHTEFTRAFAGLGTVRAEGVRTADGRTSAGRVATAQLDAPTTAGVQLELPFPTIEPSRVSSATVDFASGAVRGSDHRLEAPLPAEVTELPPVSAAADAGIAQL